MISFSQNALPVNLRENLTLAQGTYEINGTHYVNKNVTLTINQGTTLLFGPDATLRIDGGLVINGETKNLVNITSKVKSSPGNGIVINGANQSKNVVVNYVRFDYIKKPLTFEFRWSRNSVDVTNCIIKRSLYEGAAIEVKEIDNLLTERKIRFNFKDNTFSNSTSSLLISNITSDLLTIDFDNNVLTRNEYTGRTRNGIFTSPLYMTYNTYQSNDVPTLNNNSIFDNFYSLSYDDKFDVGRTNISVIGNADKLDLGGNYFGNPDKKEIEETFDFISANYQAPFLFSDHSLNLPSAELNGHFYEIFVNADPLDEKLMFTDYKKEIKTLEFRFNRPVIDGNDFKVIYHYLENDSVKSKIIKSSLKWSEGNQFLKVNLNEKLSKFSLDGYLDMEGLYDGDGMDVPIFTLGKKGLNEPNLQAYIPSNLLIPKGATKKKDAEVGPDDTLVVFKNPENTFVEFERLNDSFVHVRQKYWHYGAFIGNSVYFGDLNRSTVSLDPRNMRPNLGLRFGYQVTEKFGLNLRNNYIIISGSDQPQNSRNDNVRGTNFKRNLSFRTTIIDAALMAEYNFTRFKLKSSIVPSIFAGGSVFYFKPMAKVIDNSGNHTDNQWYDLRSIGTAGQTIQDGPGAYKKIMFGIPYGISIKRHFTQKMVVGLSYTYNKLFTDYLDDVGVDPYPASKQLEDVNKALDPGVATNLSNPGKQPKGTLRSYSDKTDGYGYWGITATWKIY